MKVFWEAICWISVCGVIASVVILTGVINDPVLERFARGSGFVFGVSLVIARHFRQEPSSKDEQTTMDTGNSRFSDDPD